MELVKLMELVTARRWAWQDLTVQGVETLVQALQQ